MTDQKDGVDQAANPEHEHNNDGGHAEENDSHANNDQDMNEADGENKGSISGKDRRGTTNASSHLSQGARRVPNVLKAPKKGASDNLNSLDLQDDLSPDGLDIPAKHARIPDDPLESVPCTTRCCQRRRDDH